MKKQLDFRVRRTYQLLMDAQMELLREKPFEAITVGELCDRAMIRRATFYKHFRDKYELFAFTIRQLQEQFRAQYEAAEPARNLHEAMIDCTLQFVTCHREVVQSVLRSESAALLFDILSREIETNVRSHLQADAAQGVPLAASPEPLAAAITGMLIYLIRWWAAEDMQMPREELVKLCMTLIHG